MNRERCDATGFSELRNAYTVAQIATPSCARFQSDWHAGCIHHGVENFPDQCLISEQRGTAQPVANFFCGAAHVDVDDLRAEIDIASCGLRQRFGVRAGELHHARLGFTDVIHAALSFFSTPKPHITGDHL